MSDPTTDGSHTPEPAQSAPATDGSNGEAPQPLDILSANGANSRDGRGRFAPGNPGRPPRHRNGQPSPKGGTRKITVDPTVPQTTADPARDSRGQFVRGNAGRPGKPFARRVAALRTRSLWATLGILASNALYFLLIATGLGALLLAAQTVPHPLRSRPAFAVDLAPALPHARFLSSSAGTVRKRVLVFSPRLAFNEGKRTAVRSRARRPGENLCP